MRTPTSLHFGARWPGSLQRRPTGASRGRSGCRRSGRPCKSSRARKQFDRLVHRRVPGGASPDWWNPGDGVRIVEPCDVGAGGARGWTGDLRLWAHRRRGRCRRRCARGGASPRGRRAPADRSAGEGGLLRRPGRARRLGRGRGCVPARADPPQHGRRRRQERAPCADRADARRSRARPLRSWADTRRPDRCAARRPSSPPPWGRRRRSSMSLARWPRCRHRHRWRRPSSAQRRPIRPPRGTLTRRERGRRRPRGRGREPSRPRPHRHGVRAGRHGGAVERIAL